MYGGYPAVSMDEAASDTESVVTSSSDAASLPDSYWEGKMQAIVPPIEPTMWFL